MASLVYLSEEVKKFVSLPVIAVGRIKDPVVMDTLIKESKADMAAHGQSPDRRS